MNDDVTKKEKVVSLLEQGISDQEICERIGVNKSYVHHVRTRMDVGFMSEWPEITGKLKKSGYDLSKIKIKRQSTVYWD